nr:transposase [Parafrankia elaeagni]
MTTKLHLACEQGQKPLALLVTAGQRGDSPQFTAVLGQIRVPRPGPGRPRTCPDRVLADKAYSSKGNRAYLRRRGIRTTIPEKKDQAANRKKLGSRGGRPPHFDPEAYKQRHAVERSKPRCCHSCGCSTSPSVPFSSMLSRCAA